MNEYNYANRGSNIRYWLSEGKDGPVAVFCHGATLDHYSFEPQRNALADVGIRTLNLDFRGHGKSQPLGEGFSVEILVEDIKAILDKESFSEVFLIGHSFGGYVAQMFAKEYPQLVKAIVIVGCTDMSEKPGLFSKLLLNVMPRMIERMSLETFRKKTLSDLGILDQTKIYGLNAMSVINRDDFISIIMAGIECMWKDYGFPAHYRLNIPFLLLHGAIDKANGGIFPRASKKWAKKENLCQYTTIPGAGHTAQLDNPEGFNSVLMEFIKKYIST